MGSPDDADDPRSNTARHDAALRIGMVLIFVGTAASVVTLLPLALGIDPFPVAVYLLCFFAPLGLGVVLVALWQRAKSRSAHIRSLRGGDTG